MYMRHSPTHQHDMMPNCRNLRARECGLSEVIGFVLLSRYVWCCHGSLDDVHGTGDRPGGRDNSDNAVKDCFTPISVVNHSEPAVSAFSGVVVSAPIRLVGGAGTGGDGPVRMGFRPKTIRTRSGRRRKAGKTRMEPRDRREPLFRHTRQPAVRAVIPPLIPLYSGSPAGCTRYASDCGGQAPPAVRESPRRVPRRSPHSPG